MGRADRATIAGGVSGVELMESAGEAVYLAIAAQAKKNRSVLVACGPGNNGGDGFVAARMLAANGYRVSVALLGKADRLKGDALLAFERWSAPVLGLKQVRPAEFGFVVDALFGAGLQREIKGEAARFINAVNSSGVPVVSVDLPSGVNGDTGAVMGCAVRAIKTITFFRKKPGHLLLPGRSLCGETEIAQIGIEEAVLRKIKPQHHENRPELWRASFEHPGASGHKYDRGHALVVSGPPARTGAARLCAEAALRAGAGLVTLASPPAALAVNATHLTAVMLRRMADVDGLAAIVEDRRFNALALGPALGVGANTQALVETALAAGRACVLDADALTSFEHERARLFAAIAASTGSVVMTPHEGEFARLFSKEEGSKVDRARSAAKTSGAAIVLKGADTVIASPDGRTAINANAPPWLATAGAGDVLAGMICGLLAQNMPAFEAACASVWLHGKCAQAIGPGMSAEDIAPQLPDIFQDFFTL